jgi:hypothetical protein
VGETSIVLTIGLPDCEGKDRAGRVRGVSSEWKTMKELVGSLPC